MHFCISFCARLSIRLCSFVASFCNRRNNFFVLPNVISLHAPRTSVFRTPWLRTLFYAFSRIRVHIRMELSETNRTVGWKAGFRWVIKKLPALELLRRIWEKFSLFKTAFSRDLRLTCCRFGTCIASRCCGWACGSSCCLVGGILCRKWRTRKVCSPGEFACACSEWTSGWRLSNTLCTRAASRKCE